MLITLCILDVLRRYSSADKESENSPMTRAQIKNKIEQDYPSLSEEVTDKKVRTRLEKWIAAEEELKVKDGGGIIGYHKDSKKERTIRTGYYLKNTISDIELKYLVDSVMFGKIFTTKQAESLARRIQDMSGKKLQKLTHYVNSSFGEQGYQSDVDVLKNVELIMRAIGKNVCISFQWNVYDVDEGWTKKVIRKKLNWLTVKPLNVILRDGRYFALVRFEGSAKVYHYSVDLMSDIEVKEKDLVDNVKEKDVLQGFQQAVYILQSPWNFGGEVRGYRLRVKREYFSRLVESFSYEAEVLPGTATGDTVDVRVHATEKGMLYWLLHHYDVGVLVDCEDETLNSDLRKATEELYKRYHQE